MYRRFNYGPNYDDQAEKDHAEEERKKKQFESEHCMYSSGDEIGPPGCCLAPKLFDRACKDHLSFTLDEVIALGKNLLYPKGPRLQSDTEYIYTAIRAALKKR